MSNLHRGHSIDDSYQVSVVAMFANVQDEMSSLHRGHSIDASYQVMVLLAKRFQRRRFKKIGQSESRIAVVAMFGNGSQQNVHSLERTFHRCFLPSFSSFG
jgi:predicted lactoylglutathione lyase